MTHEQAEKILQIVKEDCFAAGKLMNADGDTCAIGALLVAAGVELSRGERELTDQHWKVLWNEYGLDYKTIEEIIGANDDTPAPLDNDLIAARRAAVVATVEAAAMEL